MSHLAPADSQVMVTVCLWEENDSRRSLRSTRTLAVESGSPVIWALGRVARLCADFARFIVEPEHHTSYHMQGAEAFWFTPLDANSVLHVVHEVH